MAGSLQSVSDWRVFAPSLDLDVVLQAAADSFITLGYHGTTMREIARRAELSVPGLYHHYPSKQNMLVAVLDAATSDLRWRLEAATSEGGADPVHRLRLLISALVLYCCHRTGFCVIGFSEMRSLEPASRRRIATRRTEVQRLFDAVVLEGAAHGLFRTAHPLDASRAVVSLCSAVPGWFRMGQALSPGEVAERYVGYALRIVGHRA